MNRTFVALLTLTFSPAAFGAIIQVPQDVPTIQGAIKLSKFGDTVLVSPGTYKETIVLKEGITVRSLMNGTKEPTIIDGSNSEKSPGVVMAEDSTLEGITITNVGRYDEAVWKKHHDSNGEELGDDEGSVQAEGTYPAISIQGVSCVVTGCIIHHNGDVGIGILGKKATTTSPIITHNVVYRNMGGGIGIADGATPIVRHNECRENLRAGIGCRNASPIITDNICHKNIRAGIGCREGATPIIRNNKCFQNRRAGIGNRMKGTAPIIVSNECYENQMAGIGSRDGATPTIQNNKCYKNLMAGIGCRNGASPLIVSNECRENATAGIGIQQKASAILHRNKCIENKLVAVGVTTESNATIIDNDFSRTGGQPPLIAVKDGSTANIQNNRISGGGVAGVLVQGTATIAENTFTGAGPKQGNAIWVWAESTATISGNNFDQYRTAVNATKSKVVVTDNTIKRFQKTAIIAKDNTFPAHIFGTKAESSDPADQVINVTGKQGIIAENELTKADSESGT